MTGKLLPELIDLIKKRDHRVSSSMAILTYNYDAKLDVIVFLPWEGVL